MQDENIKLRIFAREKAEFARQTAMYHARKEGFDEGFKEGFEKSFKEGIDKARKKDVKKMLEKGFSIDRISEILELSKEELEELMKK